MAWYSPFLGQAGQKAVSTAKSGLDSMGITGQVDPNLYRFQHQGQIEGAINQGLGTNRTAPQVGMGNQFRTGQLQQIGQLQGIASGQQQGAGELAVQRQAQNALAAQQAQARMVRGGNAALAMRTGANNAAGIGINAAGMGQQAALQDQQMAQGLLTGALGQGRGQDMQVQIANLDARLRQMGMDDATRLAHLQQLTGMDAAQLQAFVAAKTGQQQMQGALISGLGQMGSAAFMSDERVKTAVSDADGDIDEMLDALVAKRYRYKDEKHGKGERVGILAQDMRRSRAGADVTVDTPDGIGLDVNKAISAALASVARLNKRLRAVEGK